MVGDSFIYSSDNSTRGAFFPLRSHLFSLFVVHEQIFTHHVESNCPLHKATRVPSRSSAQWGHACGRDRKCHIPRPVGGSGQNWVATEPLYFADFGFLGGAWRREGGSISNAACYSANTPLTHVNKFTLDIFFLKNVGISQHLFGET